MVFFVASKVLMFDELQMEAHIHGYIFNADIMVQMEQLLKFMDPRMGNYFAPVDVVHGCGIYVLKYLELWDGVTTWEEFTMPIYSLLSECVILV
ncbi:hypothetical protein VNO77_02947 [Canavalia gladiata]|uniref:Uncharacterized protein n=1 Tax=Canavalia gladiata TaxID=3824 RepID=A0AAN9MU08_CANGL